MRVADAGGLSQPPGLDRRTGGAPCERRSEERDRQERDEGVAHGYVLPAKKTSKARTSAPSRGDPWAFQRRVDSRAREFQKMRRA